MECHLLQITSYGFGKADQNRTGQAPPPEKPTIMTFDEEEVGRLMLRASELHEKSLREAENGLSLEEIEKISGELGIPSRFLIEAAHELQQGTVSENRTSLTGAPFRVEQSRIAHREVPQEDWTRAVQELEDLTGKRGVVSTVGTGLQWSHAMAEGVDGFTFEELKVTLRSKGGKTSITVAQEYKGVVLMYAGAFFFTSFLTLLVAHSLPNVSKVAELMIAGAGGMLSLGGVRALVAVSARRFSDRISGYADRIQHMIGIEEKSSEASDQSGTSVDSATDGEGQETDGLFEVEKSSARILDENDAASNQETTSGSHRPRTTTR